MKLIDLEKGGTAELFQNGDIEFEIENNCDNCGLSLIKITKNDLLKIYNQSLEPTIEAGSLS